jgi:pimeloyl-ACP methyl ester carboxylesterase
MTKFARYLRAAGFGTESSPMLRKLTVALQGVLAVVAIALWVLSPPRYADPRAIRFHGQTPGSVIAVEPLGGYNKLALRGLLWLADLPVKAPVSDGIEMFRVRYWSQNDGKPVEASGLMAIPYQTLGGAPSRGTAMYLHGTSPDRTNSPSAPGQQEGLLPSALFAGGGYTLLAPDYFGLGQSHAAPAYIYAPATAAAARDMVIAARHVEEAMKLKSSPGLYLVGFSQGGHATAVVQRALEADPVPGVELKAAAAIAGAFDLAKVSVPYAFTHKHSLYLGFLAVSYAAQYHQPLATLFTDHYAKVLPVVFDGNHTIEAIEAALPTDPRDLFRPEALAEVIANKPNWFTAGLAANEAWNWTPEAPLRLYYGDRDTDVSPQDSRGFYAASVKRGANIHLMPLGPYDHVGSALQAVPRARLWFDELSRLGGT